MIARDRIGDLALYRRIAGELRPYWRGMVGLLLLSFAATPLSLLIPLPLKIAVDSVIGSQPVPDFFAPLLPDAASKTAMLSAAAALLAFVTALSHALALAIGLLQTYTGERLTLGFRAKLFNGRSGCPSTITTARARSTRSIAFRTMPALCDTWR